MGGLGVNSHSNPECRFTVGEELVMGGGGGGGGIKHKLKSTYLKLPKLSKITNIVYSFIISTPYLRFWYVGGGFHS